MQIVINNLQCMNYFLSKPASVMEVSVHVNLEVDLLSSLITVLVLPVGLTVFLVASFFTLCEMDLHLVWIRRLPYADSY